MILDSSTPEDAIYTYVLDRFALGIASVISGNSKEVYSRLLSFDQADKLICSFKGCEDKDEVRRNGWSVDYGKNYCINGVVYHLWGSMYYGGASFEEYHPDTWSIKEFPKLFKTYKEIKLD